jgi:tRNA threonylcarbamoyladenosine biosynthesis protein TsaE
MYLRGDLGAGKTTLAQGFLRACGVQGPVRSPTYTLVQVYATERETVVHLDLYRLRAREELEHLGLAEWALPGWVWLIEWPERGFGGLPPADLTVALSVGAGGHKALATAGTDVGAAWLSRLKTLSPARGS